MSKCKVCGAQGKACGGPSSVAPIDHTIKEGADMSDLKRYNVVVGNRRHSTKTVLLLDAATAKARGLTDKDLVGAKAEKPSAPASAPAKPRAKRAPRNKQAAPAANKDAAPVTAPASAPADK